MTMGIEGLYNTTFTVSRLTSSQGAMGGEAGTWANLSTGNEGRIRKLSATERETLGRQGAVSSHRLYCDTSTTLVEKDRVVDASSRLFDITYVYDVDEMGHHLEVDMTLRE